MKRGAQHALWLLVPALAASCWAFHQDRASAGASGTRQGRRELSVEIDDRHGIAVTRMVQELVNPGWEDASADLDLPIRDDAALLGITVTEPRAKKGEDPATRAVISPAGRNLYHVHIGRVPGRGRARFELRYAETIVQRGARRKYVCALPSKGEPAPEGLSVRVRINARSLPQAVESTSYPLSVHRAAPTAVELTYNSTRPPDGHDLVIDYQVPASAEEPRAVVRVLPAADPREAPYFVLRIPPPAALLHGASALQRPIDAVLCFDTSGSTSGRKANAIREALHDGLTDLAPSDRFGVVAFDDDARPFRKRLVPAGGGAISAALRFVNRIRPSGGTLPARGLQAALELLESRPKASGTARDRTAIIAMVVDDDDRADLAEAAARLGLEHRGIRLVILAAMRDSRLVHCRLSGSKLKRGPAIALSRAALTYGASLVHGSLDLKELNASYLYPMPDRLPELPLSSPAVFLGRLNEPAPATGSFRLTGMIEGHAQAFDVKFETAPIDPNLPVPQLWAVRRVRRLQQLAQNGSSAELAEAERTVQTEHRLAAVPGQ